MRVQLSNEVADLINDFGPKLYEDFNEVSILVNCRCLSTEQEDSGAFSFLPLVYHRQAGPLVCGVGRVALAQWMLKVWGLHIQ